MIPDPGTAPATSSGSSRLTSYQLRLYVFLGVASFFEGYDFFALTQVLPNLRADFGLGPAGAGPRVMQLAGGTAPMNIKPADPAKREAALPLQYPTLAP